MAAICIETPGTHEIKGRVVDRDDRGIAGVRIQCGYTNFTFTDEEGNYTLRSLVDGDRTVTPSKDRHSFEPAVQQVIVAGSDIDEVDFVATAQQD